MVKHITGKPSTKSESWSRLIRYIGHWQALNFGYWVVENKSDEIFLGEVGFANHMRDLNPPKTDVPEIGWVLASHAHGRGIATEAVAAALVWGDAKLRSDRTFCMFDPDHTASQNVAKKNGYYEIGIADYLGNSALIMERRIVVATANC